MHRLTTIGAPWCIHKKNTGLVSYCIRTKDFDIIGSPTTYSARFPTYSPSMTTKMASRDCLTKKKRQTERVWEQDDGKFACMFVNSLQWQWGVGCYSTAVYGFSPWRCRLSFVSNETHPLSDPKTPQIAHNFATHTFETLFLVLSSPLLLVFAFITTFKLSPNRSRSWRRRLYQRCS